MNGFLGLITQQDNWGPGVHKEIDICVIQLSPPSIDVCFRNFDFINYTQKLINAGISDNQAYLLFGHPGSKISIDHGRRKIKQEAMAYVCKSTIEFKFEKFHFHSLIHLMLEFDQRRSTIMGTGVKSASPSPQGISGCGIWYVPDYFVEDLQNVDIKLAAILIEYFPEYRLLAAVKMDQVDALIRIFTN